MKATLMFRILMATLLAGALAFGLAACGDDDEAASSTSEHMSESESETGATGETSETSETSDGETTLPTSGMSDSASAPLSCDECIEASCADEQAACDAEPDCGGLLACAAECEDEACVNACSAANPGGIAVFLPLFTCIQTECPICLEEDGEETVPSESGTTPEPGEATEGE